MTTPISVIVPSYSPPRGHLAALYTALRAQTHTDFECIIVDDGSPDPAVYTLLEDPRFRVLYREKNAGPAVCRNAGTAEARHPLLFFTDTDCEPHPDCLARAVACLQSDEIAAGDTITKTHTIFGRAVALLGFPGGGAIGFHKVWRVDDAGYTRSFSSCNLAFRRDTFNALGRFKESFPVAGGEDTVLARHAIETGHRIRYDRNMIVYHIERAGLRSFLRWQWTRGRGNYYIKGHVPEVGGYLRLRVWTFGNSFRAAGPFYAPLVFVLLVLSVTVQVLGMRAEAQRQQDRRP